MSLLILLTILAWITLSLATAAVVCAVLSEMPRTPPRPSPEASDPVDQSLPDDMDLPTYYRLKDAGFTISTTK